MKNLQIVPNGSHDIYACAAATERVLAAQFKALADANVYLEGCLLKPNMVKNGLTGPKASPEEVAALTVQALMRTVPPAIPGIFFLSGEVRTMSRSGDLRSMCLARSVAASR